MRGKRGVLTFCSLAALAGALVAFVLAAPSAAQSPLPPPPPTTTVPPEEEEPTDFIPAGVTIGGVDVGGLLPNQAYEEVRAAVGDPLVLAFGDRTYLISAWKLGTRALVRQAVTEALKATPGTEVRLPVRVRGDAVRKYVRSLAERLDRKPVDARFMLRRLRPWITRARPGRKLDRLGAVKEIVNALSENRRDLIRLRARPIQPRVTRRSLIQPVIVIRRESRRLQLYKGMRHWRTFGVAVGQPIWPTPLGRFQIVVKWRNPWWYPPDSSWARGASPIPPGPGNPLGTRWMGLSAPGVGIHGTPDPASIGYSASHGCIRMHIPSAEWLFNHVDIGTPVYIVRA